jgi:hypothetical protein
MKQRWKPAVSALLVSVLFWFLMVANAVADEESATPNDQSQLRINEFMASNQTTLEDPHEPGEFPDWIELYNPGPNAVTLGGLFLTDDAAKPTRFPLSDTLTILPGKFMLFYADNDPKQGAQHTNFGLNKNNGFLGLYNGVSEVLIDSRSYGLQATDVSEGRQFDGSGPWLAFTQATPGATNVLLPPIISQVRQQPVQPVASAPVTITAVVTDERGLAAVTLFYSMTGGSYINVPMTAGANQRYQGQVPGQPNGVIVRYYIVAKDIDNLTSQAPAGAPQQDFRYVVGFQAPPLVINELVADNVMKLQNPALPNDYPDWIELYNRSAVTISLDGLFLTDNIENPTQYALPNGLTIAANGYLLFYADGDPNLGPQHTNFKLSKTGEYVGLYGAQGAALIDGYTFGEQLTNTSMARFPNGSNTWRLAVCTTPGAANTPCSQQLFLPVIKR